MLAALILLIAGMVLGDIWRSSVLGYPDSFNPPARQQQEVIGVKVERKGINDQWLGDLNAYLVPFRGVKGHRSYSALIFVRKLNSSSIFPAEQTTLYLEERNNTLVQPIIIEPHDFDHEVSPVVVKLIEQSAGSGQYYQNSRDLFISSQP
jgi:hypothetical protein